MTDNKETKFMSTKGKSSIVMGVLSCIALAIATAVLFGCSPKKVPVCEGKPTTKTLVAMTSESDLATAKAYALPVSQQIIDQAVLACSRLEVGVADGHSEDLVLHSVELKPDHATAFNPKPARKKMAAAAKAFVAQYLIEPLSHIKATPTSPFLGVAAKVVAEHHAHDVTGGTLLLLGDTVDVESAPSGALVDFRNEVVPEARLREFVPLLKGGPECVLIAGEAVESGLPASRLRNARTMLARTLGAAGSRFAAVTSPDVPAACPQESAR